MTSHQRRRLGAAAFPVLLALVGCGTSTPAPGRESPTTLAVERASANQTASIAPPRPVAIRAGRIDDEPVTLELSPLRRRGQVVNLELRLRTRAAEANLLTVHTFDDGVSEHLSDPDAVFPHEGSWTVDGINLIDGVNGMRYAPARDRFNHCICDRDLVHVTLSRDRPTTLSATFGAPPATVKAVDVVIPRFGTIADVPLG